MRKIAVFIGRFIFFCIFLLLFPYSVFSATNSPAADTQIWINLINEPLIRDGRIIMRLINGKITQKPNSEVYIAECIDTPNDRICTTGTFEGDMAIYQSDDNLRKLQNNLDYEYRYNGMYYKDGKTPIKNPVPTDEKGEIPILWVDTSVRQDIILKFYAVNLVETTNKTGKKSQGNLEKISVGNEGGQQQGMFKVKTIIIPTSSIEKIESEAKGKEDIEIDKDKGTCDEAGGTGCDKPCERPLCDPYGRVFDAISLEPIAGAKVILKKQKPDGVFSFLSPKETVNAIINPWTTKEDGKFVYLVPPGRYQLEIEHPDYIFPFDPKQLNPNYSKAYYELYYGPGFTDKTIIEEKTIEHRDIPLVPKGKPYRAPVKLLGYMTELDKEKMIYKVSGRTSHPLTVVEIQGKNIESGEITRTLSRVNADKWGFFDAEIKTPSLKNSETIGTAKLIKIDLTQKFSSQRQNSLFDQLFSWIQKSYAETPSSTFPINPILNYLEGYAYDDKGKTIANARVGIYLSGSKKPYYETFADNEGYYFITSQHLPQMNYKIRYTSLDGKEIEISQTIFLKQNLNTIVSNKLDVNRYIIKPNPFKIDAQTRKQTLTEQTGQNNKYSAIKIVEKNTDTELKKNNLFFITFIFFSLGGGIIGLLYFYLKKKDAVK